MVPRFGTADVDACTLERPDHAAFTIGRVKVTIKGLDETPGACLGVAVGEDEFYLLALHCTVTLTSLDPTAPYLDVLELEEGRFDEGGAWVAGRRLNGDEVAMQNYKGPTLLHGKVLLYD